MKILTKKSVLVCAHELGVVQIAASQHFVRVEGSLALVERDPEGKPIGGCPIVGVGVFPCTLTLKAQKGYSDFVYIEGKRVCLHSVQGLTNGTPPGTVKYKVSATRQSLVSIE